MSDAFALTARQIFDGTKFTSDAAILVRGGHSAGIIALADLPIGTTLIESGGDTICPGFIDWQVNGGGGVLFNDNPTMEAAGAIARAHLAFGTTALLPTLITDAPHVTDAAAQAIAGAIAAGIPGVVGVHFEGPHISEEKHGIHDPRFIRPLEVRDRQRMTGAGLGKVVTTVALENASLDDISVLAHSGVLVSLGHTNADYDTGRAAFAAGARAVTHLFNAMAPLHHRKPGLVTAAIENKSVYCGLIADGHHVHEAVLRLAVGAIAPDRLTLVTDAMPSVGHAENTFKLNGRTVQRTNGRLTIADGTLAGADLDMMSAVRFCVRHCGVPLGNALQMASHTPATMLGLVDRGHLLPGARADMLVLSTELDLLTVWLGGKMQPA